MNIIKKIIAFFKFRGEEQAVEVNSAEIREDMVFLHPTEDPDHTICIRTSNVGILIDPEESIADEDVFIIENGAISGAKKNSKSPVLPQLPILPNNDSKLKKRTDKTKSKNWSDKKHPSESNGSAPQRVNQYLKEANAPIIRRVSFDFYENEYIEFKRAYEAFTQNASVKKGNRTEFILACAKAAKKTSMESYFKKYHEEHQRMRKEERKARKKAAEELSNSSNTEQQN